MSSVLPLFSIGHLIQKLTIKTENNTYESLPISLLIGTSILITFSTLIGTLIGRGLKLFFYIFYISGLIILIYYFFKNIHYLKIVHLYEFFNKSQKKVFFIMLAIFSILFYSYYPLSNQLPKDDAAEVYLSMARYFCENDDIPLDASVYFTTGKNILISPGISILQSFIFTISKSFSPINLAFIEITFLICFSILTYIYSIRCKLSKDEASLAAILFLNLPYWGYYFSSSLHFIDLESAFMTSVSIYYLLVLLEDEKKYLKISLPILGLISFATFTSKIQSLIFLLFAFTLILKLNSLFRKYKKLISIMILIAYILLTPILVSKLYIFTTIFGGIQTIFFFTTLSVIPLIILLMTEFQRENKISNKTCLLIIILLFLSLYWYFRPLFFGYSIISPIKIGDSIWASEILKKSMKWGGIKYLYNRYYDKLFIIIKSIYLVTLLIPLILGVKYFKKLNGFFPTGIKIWVLIGLVSYLGVLEKAWRYPIYFILPITILISKGIYNIIGELFLDKRIISVAISFILIHTFPSINMYLITKNFFINSVLFNSIWIILILFNLLTINEKNLNTIKLKIKVKNKSIKIITIFILSTILITLSFITIKHQPYSKGFYIWKKRSNLYNHIIENAQSDKIIVSLGGQLGLYYFTGFNTLSILRGPDPDSLAILKPFFDAPDIDQGLSFLIHELKIGSFIFRSEQGGFYREWYTYLLDELPELRILYNPQLFKTVLYSPKYYYLLNLVNDSWSSYGVLDVIVKGKNPAEESSFFLPYDYGFKNTIITRTREGLNLSVLVYIPHLLIEKNIGKVSFEVSTNLTIKTKIAQDYWLQTKKTIKTKSHLNLSKVIKLNAGIIEGNDEHLRTVIGIDTIEIEGETEIFYIYFKLIPGSSTAYNKTWLHYYPAPDDFFNFPNYTWTHLGSNLIEVNSLMRCNDDS